MNYTCGLLIVLSGPSGVGKGTVSSMLKEQLELAECVTCTTRLPRNGEKNGIDYYFLSAEDFEKKITEDFFLEHAYVHGKYYGTPKKEAMSLVEQGKLVLLEIDIQGGRQIKAAAPEAVTIFLLPPDIDVLYKRLSGRGTESEEQIALRMKNAETEIASSEEYDYSVVNDDLNKCVQEIKTIIAAELNKRNGI